MSVKNTVGLVSEDADLRKKQTASFKSVGLTLLHFASVKDYMAGLEEHKPHGGLAVDVEHAGNGADLSQALAQQKIALPVIVVVPHGGVMLAVQGVRAGAFDVIEKPIKNDALLESARRAIGAFGKLQKALEERQIARERVAALTPRETQVLDLMVQGKPNRQIATELGISTKTLDIHRSNVMDKIEARTVADLCRAHLLDRIEISQLHLLG